MATEQFANDVQTTLASSITASQTSFVVGSAAGFPASAQYRIRCENEIMIVTGGAGTTTWTVTRGAEGTVADTHVAASDVVHVLTAGAIGGVSDPAAGVPGLRTLGVGATQAAAGNDARFSAGGTGSMFERTLASDASAAAGTITVNAAPNFIANTGLIAIDPFTIQCEIKRFTVVAGSTLTLSTALAFSHSTGDSVLFFADDTDVPVTWWGTVAGGDCTANIQAALDATRPVGTGRNLHFPAGLYKVSGTIRVGSDTRITGDGPSYTGTAIMSTTDATIFDCQVSSTGAVVKNATRIEFVGLQFYKGSANLNTTAYCIDMVGADMCSVSWCSFGNHIWGSMNGIKMGSSGVNWVDHTKFLDVGYNAGRPVATVGTSGDNAAIRVDSTSDAINVTDCQFEATSKLLLYNARGCLFKNCHFEYSGIELHNSSHNTFADVTLAATDIQADNKSNDNLFDNLAGVSVRLVDYGSNTYRRCNAAANVGRLTRDWGPFNAETSPLKPDNIAVAYDSSPAVAYGNPGDVILFAVHAVSPSNAAATTGTIRFKNTNGGGTLHASPSITLTAVFPTAEQLSSAKLETYTYWHMETVPVGGKIYIDSEFRCSVWASKTINPNPFLDSLADWSTGGATAGHFSSAASCTPTMSATQFRVDWTAGSGWSISQYTNWPPQVAPRYLMVIRGRWATTQNLTLGDNTVHSGGDFARVRSRWKPGDEAFFLQNQVGGTDKMMFAVVMPGITTAVTTDKKYFISSFGGFGVDFPANTQVEIDWCAVVALDPTPPASTSTLYDVKGDLLAATADDTPARLPVGANGQALLADSTVSTGVKWGTVSGQGATIVRKTVDEALTASTVLQNDDELLFAIGANEIWHVEAWLLVASVNTTMDIKVSWTIPSGTVQHGALGGPNVNYPSWGPSPQGSTPLALTAAAGAVPLGTGNLTQGVNLAALCVNGATPGNVQFQWAQNTSDAGALTMKANSILIAHKVA